MKNYRLKSKKSNSGTAPSQKGAPVDMPDRPLIVAIDLHPDIFDVVELRQVKRAKDAEVVRRFHRQPSEEGAKWAQTHLSPELHLIVIEATSNSFDFAKNLIRKGFTCIILESQQTSKIADHYIDDDQIAAERIGRSYLTGMAKAVWIPDEKTIEYRDILHAYDRAVCAHTRAINQLKSWLTTRSIRPGQRNLHLEKNRTWLIEKLGELSVNQQELFTNHLAELDHTKASRDRYYKMICREMSLHKTMLNCLRVVGIGIINAFAIVAIVGDITRFATPNKLVNYLGLNPGRKRSGNGKDQKKGTGNRGRGDMRSLLIQAAQSVLNKKDNNKLTRWGRALWYRKDNRNLAIVGIARKLAYSLYYILAGKQSDLLEQRKPLKVKFEKLAGELGREGREQLGLPQKRAHFVDHLFGLIDWIDHPEPIT